MNLTRYSQTYYEALAESPRATERMRDALLCAGIDGWTETASVGYWQGARIDGQTTFGILASDGTGAESRVCHATLYAHADHGDAPTGVYQVRRVNADGSAETIEVRSSRTENPYDA